MQEINLPDDLKYWRAFIIIFMFLTVFIVFHTEPTYTPQPTTYYKASFGSPSCLQCSHIMDGYGVFIDMTDGYVVKDLR